jgi:membrane protein YqaA with SNARE-associated domain
MVLLVATLSHMGGKAVIYYASSAFERLPEGRFKERIRAAHAQAEKHSNLGTALVFTSSLVGLPPLYLITVVCGALRFPFAHFFAAAFVGRIIRFAALIMLPQLAWPFAR